MAVTYCIPDTNFFHHFTFFTDVDWPSLVEAKQVTVVITGPVISELEAHKRDRDSRRRRDRSVAVLRRVDDLMGANQEPDQVKLRRGTFLRLDLDSPEMSGHTGKLDASVMDDRIIAHALKLKASTDDAVVLLTDDVGMRIKARALGLRVVEPPDSLRLDDEPTTQERATERAGQKSPQLSIAFWVRGQMLPQGSYQLGRPALLDAEVEEVVEKRKRELISKSRSRGGFQYKFPAEEEQVERYITSYRRFLVAQNNFLTSMSHLVNVPLAIKNEGSVPAEDVTVDVTIAEGWDLLVTAPGLKKPEEPAIPAFASQGYSKLTPAPRSAILWPVFNQGSWEFIHSKRARIRFSKLVHGVEEPLDGLTAQVPSRDCDLTLDYEIHAANSPNAATGRLELSVRWGDWKD